MTHCYHAGDPGSVTGDPLLGTIWLIPRTGCLAVTLLLGGLEETILSLLIIILSLSIAVHGRSIQTQSGSRAQQHVQQGVSQAENYLLTKQNFCVRCSLTQGYLCFTFRFGFSESIFVHCSRCKVT